MIIKKEKKRKREERRNVEEQADPTSSTTITNLLLSDEKERLFRRTQLCKYERRSIKRRLDRCHDKIEMLTMKKNIAQANISDEYSDSRNVIQGLLNQLSIAMNNNKNKQEIFEKVVLTMLNSTLSPEQQVDSPFQHNEAKDFLQQITTEINNYQTILQGHHKQIRFSPKILRIAMGIFFCSPAAYEDL